MTSPLWRYGGHVGFTIEKKENLGWYNYVLRCGIVKAVYRISIPVSGLYSTRFCHQLILCILFCKWHYVRHLWKALKRIWIMLWYQQISLLWVRPANTKMKTSYWQRGGTKCGACQYQLIRRRCWYYLMRRESWGQVWRRGFENTRQKESLSMLGILNWASKRAERTRAGHTVLRIIDSFIKTRKVEVSLSI